MPIISAEKMVEFDTFDSFTQGYIEAALWCGLSDDDAQAYFNGDAPFDKIAPDTLASMIDDCRDFQAMEGVPTMLMECGDHKAGVDFWLTRNGHGAGFWDGDWPEHGDKLTELSKPYGEVCLYVGDDGLIYST